MNFNKRYITPLPLFFILCVFLPSCGIVTPPKMYPIGTEWETEQYTFTVLSATLCSYYQIPEQNTVMPDQNCEFLAVECNIEYFHDFELTKCNVQKMTYTLMCINFIPLLFFYLATHLIAAKTIFFYFLSR